MWWLSVSIKIELVTQPVTVRPTGVFQLSFLQLPLYLPSHLWHSHSRHVFRLPSEIRYANVRIAIIRFYAIKRFELELSVFFVFVHVQRSCLRNWFLLRTVRHCRTQYTQYWMWCVTYLFVFVSSFLIKVNEMVAVQMPPHAWLLSSKCNYDARAHFWHFGHSSGPHMRTTEIVSVTAGDWKQRFMFLLVIVTDKSYIIEYKVHARSRILWKSFKFCSIFAISIRFFFLSRFTFTGHFSDFSGMNTL